MTTAPPPGTPGTPGAPGAFPLVPMVRRQDDRVVRGVCAALARATGTDPVLWRVCVIVLTAFGGSGILLYLAGWALIPEEGQPVSPLARRVAALRGRQSETVVLALALITLLAVLGADSDGLTALVVVGLLLLLLVRNPVDAPPAPPATPATSLPVSWSTPVTAAPPRRPRRPLSLLAMSVGVLAAGAYVAGSAASSVTLTVGRVLGVALLAVVATHLLSLRWGRPRAVVAVEVLLALALAAVVAGGVDPQLSAGDRTWTVSGDRDLRLGAGSAVLDLRPTAGGTGPVDVDARLGVGDLRITLPADRRVVVDVRVAAGQVVLPAPPTQQQVSGTSLHEVRTYGTATGPEVHVQVRVAAGQVTVLP